MIRVTDEISIAPWDLAETFSRERFWVQTPPDN